VRPRHKTRAVDDLPHLEGEFVSSTIMPTGKTGNGSKYTIERNIEFLEMEEKSPKYVASHIQLAIREGRTAYP
jgi:hypothetical protein